MDLEVVCESVRRAMAHAGAEPADIDAVIVVTCTPCQIMLDQDGFRLP